MSVLDRLFTIMDKIRLHLQNTQPFLHSQQSALLTQELRSRIATLEISVDNSVSPAQQYWNQNMLKLKDMVATNDPMNFLSWNVVSGTMFVKYARYSRFEYEYIKRRPDWRRWQGALEEDNVGNPIRCPFYSSTSCNLLHHAYHIVKFEDAIKSSIDKFGFVAEFGGGYGSMCRLVHRLGFAGRYVLIDLPAFSALQEYYLKSIGMQVLSKEEFLSGKRGVYCISDIDMATEIIADEKNGLLLATWSLSESPLDIRAKLLDATSAFDAYLFAFQPFFEDIDNVSYFAEWQSKNPEVDWTLEVMTHIKNQRYLFGKKRQINPVLSEISQI